MTLQPREVKRRSGESTPFHERRRPSGDPGGARDAGLDRPLYELIKIPASRLNGCAYCLDMHNHDARAGGEDQRRLDALAAWREAPDLFSETERAALAGPAPAANLVPTATGAACATTRALPELAGRFDGVAVRIPVAVGSIADIVFVSGRPTTVEEVNTVFREEADTARYRGVLGVSDDPLVSSDIIGDTRAAVVDVDLTQVMDGTLVKVMAWYDNERGFTHQVVRETLAGLHVGAHPG